jgi:aminoglycoside phosphotransferase family enzyme
MLDRALTTGTVTDVQFDRVVRRLAKFFRGARRHPIDGKSYVRRLRRQIAANRRELRRFGARLQQRLVDQVAGAQLECLARSRAALAGRGAHVVDGHGDLKPEHVCLGPPLCVIDRLEFDPDLRRLDPFEELAFLALELERMGHRDLATQLLRRSALMCRDNVAGAVIHFYMSHRAATRAMLAAWHLDDPQFPNARHWIARAHSYLRDALRHARRALRLASRDQLQIRGRPALEQGRKRRAVCNAPHGLPDKRCNRQDREFGVLG